MIIPEGFAEVSCKFSIPSGRQFAFVVFGVDAGIASDAVAIGQSVADAWTESGGPLQQLSTTVQLREVRTVYNGTGGTPTEGTYPVNVSGADPGAPSPPNTAFLIKKSTGFIGARNRGRMYVPGPTDTGVLDDGSILSAKFSALNGAMSQFLTSLATDGNDMVVLHNDAVFTPTPVLSLSTDLFVATQRRRLR